MSHQDKHRDLIAVLSKSLPKPRQGEELPLPPSLRDRIPAMETEKSPSLITRLSEFLRRPAAAYAASAIVLLAIGIIALQPNSKTPDNTALRGGNENQAETLRILVLGTESPQWNELRTLLDNSFVTTLSDKSTLDQEIAKTTQRRIVLDFTTNNLALYPAEQADPSESQSLPATAIETLALIQAWKD